MKVTSENMSEEYSTTTLDRLALGETATIEEAEIRGDISGRLADFGFSRGRRIKCVLISPLGDPRAYEIRGAVVALRQCDAAMIKVAK